MNVWNDSLTTTHHFLRTVCVSWCGPTERSIMDSELHIQLWLSAIPNLLDTIGAVYSWLSVVLSHCHTMCMCDCVSMDEICHVAMDVAVCVKGCLCAFLYREVLAMFERRVLCISFHGWMKPNHQRPYEIEAFLNCFEWSHGCYSSY